MLRNVNKTIKTYQMLFKMKKSWIKIHPNGSTPPIIIPGIGLVYIDWSGICLGIWFVLTGCSIAWMGKKKLKIKLVFVI